ncbi:unnamed protein product [Trichogramma brassicae]|uniref:Reverse transcriptase/retrotransposon-derived protein RNase H-like domain-containing protein n=1 Tax=Trichogramma brassicae TaxID=86971 RepID=A0A6H5I3V4_9HYME|nr:unnamed protein product [Trichogramma brassicae]
MSPLTDLLRGLQKKKEKLAWSAQADEAFERIKQAMASAVRSAFYHPGQPLALHTDASNTAIGAALSQRHADDDDWTPLGFLAEVITNSAEVLNVRSRAAGHLRGDQIFSEDTRGSKLHHHDRSSPSVLRPRAEVGHKFSPRQSRQLDFISRFDAKIVYTPGDENPVADALSRIDAITMPTTLNSAQISAEQQKDDEQLTHLRGKAKLKLHDVVIDGLSLVCVEQRDGLKPYLPESLRRQAFDTAHSLSSERQSYREASRAAILLAVDEQGHRALGEAMPSPVRLQGPGNERLRVSSARHHSQAARAAYTGPHRVIRRINERNFVVDVNGVAQRRSLPISSSQPTWMSPTAEHHRQHRSSSQLPRSLHQHGESPFHSLRKLPSPLGGGE